MIKGKNLLFLLVVGCLLGYILFFKVGYEQVNKSASMINDTVIVTVIDTVKIPVYVKRKAPEPVAVIGDSANEIKVYSRNIIPDSLGSLVITDSVQHNRLLGYSIAGKINSISRTEKIFITQPSAKHNKLLVGANFSYTPEKIYTFINLQLITKKGLGISAGYDVINKTPMIGFSKVITFRK